MSKQSVVSVSNESKVIIGASLSEPHIDGTCVHLQYMYVGGGGSTYVPPFTIVDYKYIPYTLGTTCTRLYTLGVRYECAIIVAVYILALSLIRACRPI